MMVKFVGIAPLRRAACSPITSDSELERLEFQFYKLKWLILGRKYTNYLPFFSGSTLSGNTHALKSMPPAAC